MPSTAARPAPLIEHRIYLVRGRKVLIDADLASLYGVPTKSLNLAVRRNRSRFPKDFMFQLTAKEAGEFQNLRFQFETSSLTAKTAKNSKAHGGRRYKPYAFTEQGVAMLSSVLSSKRAISVNIVIMREFVRLRKLVADNQMLADRMEEIEREQTKQSSRLEKQSHTIDEIFIALKELAAPELDPNKRRIGFPVARIGAINEY